MKNFVNLIRTPFAVLLQADYGSLTSTKNNRFSNVYPFMQLYFKKVKRFFKNSPFLPFIVVIVIITVIAGFAIKNAITKTGNVTSASDKFSIAKPFAGQILNKVFHFPLKDGSGKEVSKVTYEIENVELRKEILVKGQKATAIKGRAFLVISLKITNNYNKTISINARDYIRFIINNSSEKLAPDIHSDPVEVLAISTKPTRVGIAVNDTDRNIVLQVGEVDDKKESIKLDLR